MEQERKDPVQLETEALAKKMHHTPSFHFLSVLEVKSVLTRLKQKRDHLKYD